MGSGDRSVEQELVGDVRALTMQARKASHKLAASSGKARQSAIAAMPDALAAVKDTVLEANARDMAEARDKGTAEPFLKRLEVSPKTFDYMLNRLREVSDLDDPVGRVISGHTQPDGLQVMQVSVPLGVIGIIYEARPNVTTDAASVCLKSGNAVILRGGSESVHTNRVLLQAMQQALVSAGLPEHALQQLDFGGHDAVRELLQQKDCIDVIIPRGGKSLIRQVEASSRIPVIKHYDGICHQYIASDADLTMAIEVVINSKCQRVEVCNALETLLIDQAWPKNHILKLAAALAEAGVELRGCAKLCQILPDCMSATEEDWRTEYLSPILSVRLVDGISQAMEHIATYGSGHTDGIITQSMEAARIFTTQVDSASVMVNASTRLSGGGDYGMGAVVGISTDRLHARGPVGPEQLTTYKYIATGQGHLRK